MQRVAALAALTLVSAVPVACGAEPDDTARPSFVAPSASAPAAPPPSSTIRGPFAFLILAVSRIAMVTGAGPQSNRMIPPAATARTTAAEVQLSGVPRPMTRSGRLVFSASASYGTGT